MSLSSLISAAAAEAQKTIAQLQGMAPGAGNTLFAGQTTPVTGAYGAPIVLQIPLPGGGYRKKTVTQLRIVRTQLTAPPAFNTRLMRTDLTPAVTYVIDHVGTQDPIDWVFELVNFSG
jgi:hypothetical protein